MVKVLSFEPAPDFPNWWILELDRTENPKLLVYNNWVNEHGKLKPGDEVVANGTTVTYSQVKIPCALGLERAPKAAVEA